MDAYARFLALSIDLTPVGFLVDNNPLPYFCTPKDAVILGRVGVDGIHFCTVPDFGEMVFAVSPMNDIPDLVRPVAKDFTDFLRLLLACGDTAAIEQAWMWSAEQFAAFVADNPPTADGRAVLDTLAEKMQLTPMEDPFAYIRGLQATFDTDQIPYTEEYYDTVG